jgi:hypothetical protein
MGIRTREVSGCVQDSWRGRNQNEGDPGYQLLTEEEIVTVIFLIYFVSTT